MQCNIIHQLDLLKEIRPNKNAFCTLAECKIGSSFGYLIRVAKIKTDTSNEEKVPLFIVSPS